MKKSLVIFLMIMILLAGCGKQPTAETVNDTYIESPAAEMQQVIVILPEEVCVPVMQTDGATLYMCQDYTLSRQTFASGDLQKTFREVTGFDQADLKIMETTWENAKRYDFVWSAAGETGEQVCRGCILDDGNYHYVLTAAADARDAGRLQSLWREVFNSFRLVSPQMPVSTGS